MHFPKFWMLAKKGGVSAWGWSDVSTSEALSDGLKRVDRLIDWLRNGMQGERGPYGYPDRPMREDVVREFRNASGELKAAVSRNSYGCLVLNTTEMLFVDVDEEGTGFVEQVMNLFGGKRFESNLLGRVKNWIASHPGWGWRVYRTRAGIRLLATHQPIATDSPICFEAFKAFRADRLYQKLCANQKCFRARITPKPWRCGMQKLKFRWPWRDAAAEREFSEWEQRYSSASRNHSICRFLGHFGKTEIHPELRELITFHDTETRIQTGLPLA